MAQDADRVFELIKALQERRALVEGGSVSLLLDQNGVVVYYNLPAQTVLDQQDGLAISEDGKLIATEPRSDPQLSMTIHNCLKAAMCAGGGNAAFLQVHRPSGSPPYLVFLWPCRAGEAGPDRGPGLLVVINDPAQNEHTIQHLLSKLYELTPSEVQVAMHLLEGLSAKQIAEERGVSITTVRTQIRNLLMKTDTQRQSEFIALVFRCLSLLLR